MLLGEVVVNSPSRVQGLEDESTIINESITNTNRTLRARYSSSNLVLPTLTSRHELLIRLGFKDITGDHQYFDLREVPNPAIEHDISLFSRIGSHELGKTTSFHQIGLIIRLSRLWFQEPCLYSSLLLLCIDLSVV